MSRRIAALERRAIDGSTGLSDKLFPSDIIDESSQIVCRYLADGTVTYANGACCKWLQQTHENLIGADFLALVPEQMQKRVREHIDVISRKQEPSSAHLLLSLSKADGWQHWKHSAIFDEGQIVEFQSVGWSTTGQEEAELQIVKRERLLAAIVDVQNMLAAAAYEHDVYQSIVERLGHATEVSRVYLFENHRRKDGILCTSQKAEWCADGIEPQIDNPMLQDFPFEEIFPDWTEVLSSGKSVSGNVQELSGEKREVLEEQDIKSIVLIPLLVNGQFFGFMGFDECLEERQWEVWEQNLLFAVARYISQDIERKWAYHALKEVTVRNQALIDAIPDQIFWVTSDGKIELRSEPRDSIPEDEVRTSANRTSRSFTARVRQVAKRAIKKGSRELLEYTIRNSDDDDRHYEARIVAAGSDAAVVMIRDTSERKRLEQAIVTVSVREQRRIGHMLHDGLASHLTGMMMLSRALARDVRDGRPISQGALEELCDLARDGVEQARILARGLNPVKFDSEGISAALQDLINSMDSISNAKLHLETDDSVYSIRNDVAFHLYWIAKEAVLNAVKHAQPQNIYIRLSSGDDDLTMTVEDDGVGFVELPDKSGDTSGLGLHIMRNRAEMIGGTFKIAGADGEGTTLTCKVPLAMAKRELHG